MKDVYKGCNTNDVVSSTEREKSLKKAAERKENAIPTREVKGNGRELFEMGRKAYFDEYFYGIKSELNDSASFKKGYEAAVRAVKFNIAIPDEYLESNTSVKKR